MTRRSAAPNVERRKALTKQLDDATERRNTSAKQLDNEITLKVQRLQHNLESLWQEWDGLLNLLSQAKASNAHIALGFDSWTAYVAERLKIIPQDREQRRELVLLLSGEELSQRAIAKIVGVDQKTVNNDLKATEENSSVDHASKVVSLDGKRRPKHPDPPKYVEKGRRAPINVGDIVRKVRQAQDSLFRAEKLLTERQQDDRYPKRRSAFDKQIAIPLARIAHVVTQLGDKLDPDVLADVAQRMDDRK